MDLLTHTDDRRLLVRMAALSLIALTLVAALSLTMTVYVNGALADTYAGIIGTVAQKYPQAEAQVVRDLSEPDALSVRLGRQVLGRYGLQDLSAAQSGIGVGLLFLAREGLHGSAESVFGELELLRSLDQFFDRAIYHAVVGFERAASQVAA